MKPNDIPVSLRQVFYLAFTIFMPLLLAAVLIIWVPSKPGQTGSDFVIAAGVLGIVSIVLLVLVVVVAHRHAVEIVDDAIVIKHSLYTLVLERNEVNLAHTSKVNSIDQLGLSTRKNGIAAFGYYSGWFWGAYGDLTFCAVSKWPVYLIKFEGSSKCRQIALSASPEVISSIENWARVQEKRS